MCLFYIDYLQFHLSLLQKAPLRVVYLNMYPNQWEPFSALLINEPAHVILALIAYAKSECSGESAHMRRLTRAFTSRIHKVWKQMKSLVKVRPLVLLDTPAWAFVRSIGSYAISTKMPCADLNVN